MMDCRLALAALLALVIPAAAETMFPPARTTVGMVSLEQFGGGPGVSDNSAAFATAMSAIDTLPYGGKLVLAAGLYKFSSQVTAAISAGKTLVIEGAGCQATKLQYTGGTAQPLVYAGSSTSDSSNLLISGLGFRSPSNGAANVSGAWAIEVYKRPGAILDNVCVEENYYGGVEFILSPASKVLRSTFVNIKGTALSYAADGTANNAVIRDAVVSANGMVASLPAIVLAGAVGSITANGIEISGLDIESNYQGIRFSNVSGVTITGLYSENMTDQDLVCTAACTGVSIISPWFGAQSATMTFANFASSSVTTPTVYNRTVTFDSTALDFSWGPGTILGTASVTNAPPYAALSLLNSWTAVASAGYPAPGFKKLPDGTITLRGSINGGANATVAFQLPVGYRPSYTMQFIASNVGTGSSEMICQSNGNCIVQATSGGYIALDQIRFTP